MADSGKGFPRRYKYYEILEVSKNATQEEIKKAFRHLAQKYHPDRNSGNTEAEAKFKKINEAYQVLSNPTERATYDSSPAECPVCWTHEVIQISDNNWKCRHCGCQFDVFGFSLSETIERAAIPGRYRVRLTAFQSTQCSWCRRFFTEPFLCPDRKLHSSCFFFKKLPEEERDKFLNDEKWWWRIVDLVRWTENNGVIKKCVQCGALNPNPEKLICWNCVHNIYDRCPNCGLPTLYFDLDINLWRCSNAKCFGKRFTFEKQTERYSERYERSPVRCPKGHELIFDSLLRLWKCAVCKRTYTDDELFGTPIQAKDEARQEKRRYRWDAKAGGYTTYEPDEYSEFKPSYEPPNKREHRTKIHRKLPWTAIPLLLLATTGIAIIVYTLCHFDELGYVIAIGIISAAGVTTIWNIATLQKLWRYRPRKASFKRIFISFILVALVGCTAAAFTGIAPFSNAQKAVTGYFTSELSVSPQDLKLDYNIGYSAPTETLRISNLGGGELGWNALEDIWWLALSPESGTLGRGESEEVYLEVRDVKKLAPGEYSGSIVISSPEIDIEEQIIVTLLVNESEEVAKIREIIGTSVEIYYDQEPFYSTGSHSIHLINNNLAANPTWQELVQFIASDNTDAQTYIPGVYMCGSFAEALHNSVEQAGIRAAWVAVDLEEGEIHALNAFNTVDRGIVFVDCTGGGLEVIVLSFEDSYSYDVDYDKIAYVQIGEEYGLISLEKAESPSYNFYEDYMQEWEDYERGVDEYNRLLRGRTVIRNRSEYRKLKRMYDELESQREILGDYRWGPLGVVSLVEVYW